MANIYPTNSERDAIVLPVYYRLPNKELSKYEVCWPVQPVDHPLQTAVAFCQEKVEETLSYKERYNLAILVVIDGGKA